MCISAGANAQVKALPEAAKLVPAETVLLVEIDNFSQLKQQFEKTNLYKLYKDPAMKAFVDSLKEKWQEKVKKADDAVVEAIVNADILPQGRVAFALVLNKKAIDAGEPMALFITQWGETTSKIKEAVDKQVKKAIEGGMHQKTEDYRGVTIKTMISEDSSRLSFGFSSALSYCFVDDCLIGSEDMEVLKFAIAQIKGAGSATLSDDGDYTAAIAAVGPSRLVDIDVYVNIKHIIKTVIAKSQSTEPPGQAQMWINNLGFDNIISLGCSIGMARRPGSSWSSKAFLKISGVKKGVCKMLEFESAVIKAPRFIPVSAYSVTFLNLNIKKAHDELYSILYTFSPMYAAMIPTTILPSSPDGQAGLELKSDFIDHLGSEIIFAQSLNKSFSSTGTEPPAESLVALAVNNRNALEKSISRLHSTIFAANNPDASRELLGHTIYLIDLFFLPFFRSGMTPMQTEAEPAVGQIPKVALTVTDTHLIFATEKIVEQAIRSLSSTEATSVNSAKWFTSAKLAMPTVVGLASLEDSSASTEFVWKLLKQNDKTKSEGSSAFVGASLGPNPGLMLSQAGLFDVGLLPEFDAVRKYFGSISFYGISRSDGCFFEFNYLNPAATD
jgi:hypothetical protein